MEVVFDPVQHKYTLNNKELISTTTLLKKYNLGVDYGNIPASVLQKAAAKGNAVHDALDRYVKGDTSVVQQYLPVQHLDKYIKERGIDMLFAQSEQIVYNDTYMVAGTIDFEYIDGNEDVLADFKTTSTLHYDAVSWQLSIYNYLRCEGDIIKYYFKKLKCFHFNSDRMYVKDIATISYDEVEALLNAHKTGAPTYVYSKPNNIIAPSEETLLFNIQNEIQEAQNHLDHLEKEKTKLTERIRQNFVDNKQYSYSGPQIKLSYRAPQHRKYLNKSSLKEFLNKHGKKLDDYYTTKTTKDGVTVKIIKS